MAEQDTDRKVISTTGVGDAGKSLVAGHNNIARDSEKSAGDDVLGEKSMILLKLPYTAHKAS